METGTCSRRKVFRKGSCRSCPLLLTIFSVFKSSCWSGHLNTALPHCSTKPEWPPKNNGTGKAELRPPARLATPRMRANSPFLVGVGIVRGLELDAQRRADQIELLAEA